LRDKKNIYDIAREAGVSIATVSRVLSGQQNVNGETVGKVMAVVDKYNYRPSAMARNLYQKRSKALALILPEMTNPYYAKLYAAAEEEARQKGYVLMLFHPPKGKSIDRELTDLLMDRRVDGVAINGEFLASDHNPEEFSMVQELSQYMPVVLTGCVLNELPCITLTTDLSSCQEISVAHLHELGHHRIALLCGNDDIHIPQSRDVGYRSALQKAGIPYRPEYRIFGDCSTQGGYDAAKTLMESLSSTDWPTGIIAANDLVALGVMKLLTEKRLRIPEDVSVIGCDDQFFSAYTTPALTTLNTKPEEIGIRAVALLLASQEGFEKKHFAITPSLIPRASCGPCRSK